MKFFRLGLILLFISLILVTLFSNLALAFSAFGSSWELGDLILVGAGLLGGLGMKQLAITLFPASAPFFIFFDRGGRQLLNIINAASDSNDDLKARAEVDGLRIARSLIQTE